MIEVQHLTKRYGPVTAVDDVTFRVEPGEILGFLGPNGAGKTTTMRIITGYMPASEGQGGRGRLRRLRAADRGQAPNRLPAGDPAALPGHDRARVPAVRRARSRACAQGHSEPRRRGHEADLGRPTWPTATAASSRRATASASAWRRPSFTTPTSSSSTSRPPASTRSRSSRPAS